jgi:hypothetical protein
MLGSNDNARPAGPTYAPEGLRCEFLFHLEPATIDTPPAAGTDWAI